jgi:ASPIC and UnbV/FG-GAP-like repeat
MRSKLLFALLSVLVAAGILPAQSRDAARRLGTEQTVDDRASKNETGWFRRPPGAGDYKELIDFPSLERPPAFADHWPDARDLAAYCAGETLSYRDLIAGTDLKLSKLESQKLSELDVRILELPRLYEKLGNLAGYQGDMEASIAKLEASYRLLKDSLEFYPKGEEIKLFLEEEIGLAYLRQGELQNCQLNHNAEMCILPISVRARHKLTAGSEKAIEYFTKCLEGDPDNLEVRWLLNIAYMTLGKYPAQVPKAQLIPLDRFESTEDIGRFSDVASSVGINEVGSAGGAIVDDFDGDGFLDVVTSSFDPCEPVHYYHNDGNGAFSDWTSRSKLSDQPGGLNIVQTDYNNDGRLDLYVMRGGWDYPMRNSLLRNNADGTFTDVTSASGLDSGSFRTHSAVWADFDNDGWLDVYIGHEYERSQLFRNKGDGTFEDVSHTAGLDALAFTKGAVGGDYDNDGYPDLYVSNFAGDNFLFHNNRNGTFTDVAKRLGVEKPLMSFPCWFFDYNNDGLLDIFVASFVPSVTEVVRGFLGLSPQAETMKLYKNTGKDGFQDVTRAVGLNRVIPTMGANFGDLDNDGYLDFYLGTGAPSYAALMPNFMFHNRGGRHFSDVTTSTGTGHLQKGHGVAFSDVDNDGDQDVFINIGGAAPGDKYNRALFLNPGQGNNWLSIKLTGVKSNRAAIGAKIKVIIADAAGRPSSIYREVTSGGSFGASSLTQSIGLGKASRVKSLEIFWPASRTRQTFTNVAVNQFIMVKELEKDYQKRQIRSEVFNLEDSQPHQHRRD